MSKIEWTGETWNCVIGCTHASEGCRHCYAEGQVHRFGGRYDRPATIKLGRKADALTRLPVDADGKTLGKGAQWTGAVWLLPDVLELPLRRRRPTTYFVNSLADWAHESVVESEQGRRFLAAMFGVMAATPQHTYQLLSKRDMRPFFKMLREDASAHAQLITGSVDTPVKSRLVRWFWSCASELIGPETFHVLCVKAGIHDWVSRAEQPGCFPWPLSNAWIGSSIEDLAAKTRIDALRSTTAGLRFLSIEPLLEDIGELDLRGIDWVIVGGESGPKARPCDVAWIRSVVEQCKAAGVPVFCKQLGARPIAQDDYPSQNYRADQWLGGRAYALDVADAKGGDMSEWPEDLRVREMPA